MGKIKLLDCTLRDGAYINKSVFGEAAIRGIIDKLQEAGTEIIECGWLKDAEYKKGTSYFHVPSDLEQYLNYKNSNVVYTVMIDWDRYNLDQLPFNDHKSIDGIRVVFPHGKYKEGIEVGKKILEKGYKLFLQAANTLAYSNEDLVDLAMCVNNVNCEGLSIVDTFGAMYEEDLERIAKLLNEKLRPEIRLGFHSHNNQQLSFSLCIHFIKMMENHGREIIVDSSLCGMGRGAGNTTTELMVSYLNRKCGAHYDMDSIMDAIDVYMEPFKEKFKWGYSTPYFIAGMYCCHVNNIAYLLDNHRTNSKDMRNIIESMSETDRRKYDYDLLENKYLLNQSKQIDDSDTINKLKDLIKGRKVLLIAPGKSVVNNYNKIVDYINNVKPVVIGINSIIDGYDYDYLFFVNNARYEYAKNSNGKIFHSSKRILLSNIKNTSDEEFVINYENVIKTGYPHFDNAMITALRLMEKLEVENVYIAGFDGFKNKYNESYADSNIPSYSSDIDWEELNKEISDMYINFKKELDNRVNIEFLTESIFDK